MDLECFSDLILEPLSYFLKYKVLSKNRYS